MTLSTSIRITGDVSPEGLFATARGIIGIPANQPLAIDRPDDGVVRTASEPGGFDSALHVIVALDGPRGTDQYGFDDCPGPLWTTMVRLDTACTPSNGQGDIHRRICAELGAWLDSQGADWSAQDEYTGEWHHRTACPVIR